MADDRFTRGRNSSGSFSRGGGSFDYVAPKNARYDKYYKPTPKPPPITLPKISILEPREWEKDDG